MYQHLYNLSGSSWFLSNHSFSLWASSLLLHSLCLLVCLISLPPPLHNVWCLLPTGWFKLLIGRIASNYSLSLSLSLSFFLGGDWSVNSSHWERDKVRGRPRPWHHPFSVGAQLQIHAPIQRIHQGWSHDYHMIPHYTTQLWQSHDITLLCSLCWTLLNSWRCLRSVNSTTHWARSVSKWLKRRPPCRMKCTPSSGNSCHTLSQSRCRGHDN